MQADIFCRVIDNLGDIGVTWRLARQLHAEKDWQIRLWLDNLSALRRLEPQFNDSLKQQTRDGVEVLHWSQDSSLDWSTVTPKDTVIASFSCDLPPAYIKQMRPETRWLQLEYLSAESWVKAFHRQTSQRSDGLRPTFFFPGFEKETGGLLHEGELEIQRDAWQRDKGTQTAWLQHLGVQAPPLTRLGSVFTYDTAPLDALLNALATESEPTHLLVPQGVNMPAISGTVATRVTWQSISFQSQQDYDKLLWSMDFNLVRGEDSFVRAIWAGKPFIWQAYPQEDGAHHKKIEAFLTLASFPEAVNRVTHAWSDALAAPELGDIFKKPVWNEWQQACSALSARLAEQTDLASQIDDYCREDAKKATKAP